VYFRSGNQLAVHLRDWANIFVKAYLEVQPTSGPCMPEVRSAVILEQAAPDHKPRVLSERLMGLAIIAAVPALFWTGLIYLGAALLGSPLQPASIMLIAGTIFVFLGCIWACFAIARRAPQENG
jgi:hypothetical protein